MFRVNGQLIGGNDIASKYHIPDYPYFAYFEPESNMKMTKVYVENKHSAESVATWMIHLVRPPPKPEVKLPKDDLALGMALKEL